MSAEPQQIERVGKAGLKVRWNDGHESHYDWKRLRAACPCAVCRPATEPPAGLQSGAEAPAPVSPVEIKPVGRYAMAIRWDDGHATGIFSYDYLRSLCACEECKPDQLMEG